MGVRTAVIGAGTVSDAHLSADAANPNADLVAVCDLDERRARAAASEYGITPYFDLDELLAGEDLDLVHVCTSVQTHLPLARSVIEAGVACVIEKPIAESVAEVEELQSLSERHDVPVTVIHQGLFGPAMRKARRLIDAGELGELQSVQLVKSGLTYPDEAQRGEWVFELPGGEFEEGLPHHIYPALAVGGYPEDRDAVDVVTSLRGTYEEAFTYDSAQVQYTTESGTLCTASMTAGGQPEQLLQVQGTDGSITVDMMTQVVLQSRGTYEGSSVGKVKKNVDACFDRLAGTARNAKMVAERQFDEGWETEKRINTHAYQLAAVVDAVSTGGPMPVPLEEGWWTIAIMELIREEGAEPQKQASVADD
ncbi:oxidoreductase domain-containing protein [Halosimplex carlsbadense 2-9-1]|uniref:Oxidoreductase domain-containing protein n=1 Tax=Halosimplex carlsbadense 2-9-1 TaxID=797114 RepID=M0CIQ5_9EURY|nr:Gfo/Idh/MocA family oxidoreductase [Halosimplex carlsbadense]ELZ23111.1 oxidoreductase domain-containing protein [Halosimplex carlsbadense 2-9-1]